MQHNINFEDQDLVDLINKKCNKDGDIYTFLFIVNHLNKNGLYTRTMIDFLYEFAIKMNEFDREGAKWR